MKDGVVSAENLRRNRPAKAKRVLTIPPRRNAPTLRFSPTAWAKLLYLRDRGETEVGGFGITDSHDLLCVSDMALVQQRTTTFSVRFDDRSVAEFFDAQVDAGHKPAQFARIWIHTHPGNSAQPSAIDEATFARVFGRSDWAVMMILAQGGETFARLQFHVGPKGGLLLPCQIDYGLAFTGSDPAAWDAEYAQFVQPESTFLLTEPDGLVARHGEDLEPSRRDADFDYWEDIFGGDSSGLLPDDLTPPY